MSEHRLSCCGGGWPHHTISCKTWGTSNDDIKMATVPSSPLPAEGGNEEGEDAALLAPLHPMRRETVLARFADLRQRLEAAEKLAEDLERECVEGTQARDDLRRSLEAAESQLVEARRDSERRIAELERERDYLAEYVERLESQQGKAI